MEYDVYNYLKYIFTTPAPMYILLGLSFFALTAMSLCSTRARRLSEKKISVPLAAVLSVAGAAVTLTVFFLLGLIDAVAAHVTLRFMICYAFMFALLFVVILVVTNDRVTLIAFNCLFQVSVCIFLDVTITFFVKYVFGNNLVALFVFRFVLLAVCAVLEKVFLASVLARLDEISRSNRAIMIMFPVVSVLAMMLVAVYPIPYTVGFAQPELLDPTDVGTLVTFVLVSFAVAAAYINFFRVINSAASEREEQRELTLERERNKYFEQQSEMAKSNMELVKKQIHDLRHHNMVILGYLQHNDIVGVRKYLSSYDKKLESDIMTNYCINAAVNNVLVGTTKAAKDDGIETIIETAVPHKCKVDDSELVVVFANIYENAIEACRKLPVGRKKWIRISCKHSSGKLLIEAENSCGDVVFEDDEMPKSSKSRGGGQGTRSVARVIHKYGGVYSFSEKDGVFKFRAVLPV